MEEINGFEWDSEKALRNQQKHGVSFIEAVRVFYDNNAMLIPDPDHSSREERFLLLGRRIKIIYLWLCIAREIPTFGLFQHVWQQNAKVGNIKEYIK
ncbi:hypothetical protein MHA_1635 [Mannheimia haemolytica PHL213]|nr:BrnT family toxin [Mannheimia haemolytica]EDN74550.1 hypothetical protein MHA_1635 [Mannheimia haemolytica PHL213]